MNAPCPLAVIAETIAAHESEVACHGLVYTDADRLREARAAVVDARMKHAGAVGLLCELSTRITDPNEQDALDRCVADWCALTGWTWRRVLDRVEVFPPEVTP